MERAETTTLILVQPDGRTHYPLPPHGYIERIELRPRAELPNMNVGRPCRLVVDVYDGDGMRVPVDVILIARDVKE